MNPEFQRQLWLNFSLTRAVVLPVILLLAALATVASASSSQVPHALVVMSLVAFALVVLGMGVRAAGASVVDEMIERTWDQQRMCALQPWAMTWGKLFGATAYAWYGGAFCLLVFLLSALAAGLPNAVSIALAGVLGGVGLQALLLGTNLQLARVGGKFAQRGGIWSVLLLLLWGGSMAMNLHEREVMTWWGFEFSGMAFVLLSLTVFAISALVAAWRAMAESLAVRQLPWGWPALALVLAVYVAGFQRQPSAYHFALAGLIASLGLTYAALVTEPHPRTLWARVLARAGSGQWRAALQQLPRWPTTLALALVFALWASVGGVGKMDAAMLSYWAEVSTPTWAASALPLVLVLMALRDCALALFFAFNPKARRPLAAFMVLMVVLHGLLPWLLVSIGGVDLLALVLPLVGGRVMALVVGVAHAGAALALLRWRWVNSRP